MSKPFAAEDQQLTARHRLMLQLRRPFVRQAGILQVGSFASLGISFLLSVALARALGRDGYGAYALVVATLTAISLFKRLGQDYVATTSLAAAYARRDSPAARDSLAAFNVITTWSTLLVVPPALLLAPAISGLFFHDESLAEPLRLALLPPVWGAMAATLVIVLQCSRRLVWLTIFENGRDLTLALAGVALVLAGGGVNGFFAAQVVASLLFTALAVSIYQRVQASDRILPSLRLLVADVARPGRGVVRMFRSGLAVAFDKNLVSLYPLAPILLLGSQGPTEDVALLRVAMTYMAVPLTALRAVSRLLMVKFPELHATQPERVRRFYLQVTATGGAISVGLTLALVLLAVPLIELVYGPDYLPAAHLVPFLAPVGLLAGFGIAAGPIFRTYARNMWAVYANLAVLACGLPIAYYLIRSQGLEGAALAYAGLITLLGLVAYLLCLKIVSRGQ
jgi:O-antigen/teichoic acid export membrane protein